VGGGVGAGIHEEKKEKEVEIRKREIYDIYVWGGRGLK